MVTVEHAVSCHLDSHVRVVCLQEAAYSEVSIRELLQWVQYVLLACQPAAAATAATACPHDEHLSITAGEPAVALSISSSEASPEAAAWRVHPQLLSDTAYDVYAARFRTDAARAVILQVITAQGWPVPSGHSNRTGRTAAAFDLAVSADGCRQLTLGSLSFHWQLPGGAEDQQVQQLQQAATGEGTGSAHEAGPAAAASAHQAVLQLVTTAAFIQSHGVYMVQPSWLELWLGELQQQAIEDAESAGWLGIHLYAQRFRHHAARTAAAVAVAAHFGISQDAAAAYAADIVSSDAAAPQHMVAAVLLPPVEAETPFVVTPRFLAAWQAAARSLQAAQPLLLIGQDGCGKSLSLRVLSWLLGMQLQQVHLTPETESAQLVGQDLPAAEAGAGDPVVWVDGLVTAAYKAGSWLCLDGLAEAEPAVLERLNPLLESPAFWVATEAGSTQPLPHKDSFRFLATMTPPRKAGSDKCGNLANELSPAMYNRLSLVFLEDVLQASDAAFKHELQQIAGALCVDPGAADPSNGPELSLAIAAACCRIRAWVQQQQPLCAASGDATIPPLTLRSYVRVMDLSYRMQHRYGLAPARAFMAAFDLSMAGQLSAVPAEALQQLRQELAGILQVCLVIIDASGRASETHAHSHSTVHACHLHMLCSPMLASGAEHRCCLG